MSVKSHDEPLEELLKMVEMGKAQLPEFQRSWVWDNTQICKLIESITSGYPMGAAMFLANGGDSIRFKYRKFTGVDSNLTTIPEWLVLDGQQRLTTLYQVFKCKTPVITRLDTNKDKTLKRYYYLDIKKFLNPDIDRLDAIISIPHTKLQTSNIGRDISLDLSTQKQEFENLMFPLNITFDSSAVMHWMMNLNAYYHNDVEIGSIFMKFYDSVIKPIIAYKIPVIELGKDTPREAVCQIFENVNTGGVPLTVFELVTATFAADEYDLRADWNEIYKKWVDKKLDVLKDVSGVNFLAAMSLLVTYQKYKKGISGAVSCKKREILKLELEDYRNNRDCLIRGFIDAASFLAQQGIYRSNDLPYTSQLIPLAAIFAYDKSKVGSNSLILSTNIDKLVQWYWCGVFGELYGGANEARFALDIVDIFEWINEGKDPDTVVRANFQPTRLLSMQTRNSAAYKGVMALIMQSSPLDFMSGNKMDIASYLEEDTDIHHIFPQAYCIANNLPQRKWNSVINKTPIYAGTNRSIGGRAPSEYIKTMQNKKLSQQTIDLALKSHMANPDYLRSDNFDEYFIDRAIQILNRIEAAIGKAIPGRDSDETIKEYGVTLKRQASSI